LTGLLLSCLLLGPDLCPSGGCRGDLPVLPAFHEMDSRGRSDPAGPLPVDGVDMGGTPSSVVFGFLPYWTGHSYLRYDLISVLACFSVDMGSAGTITAWHGFPGAFEGPVAGVHAAGGSAVVTVTCFSGSGIHSILTSSKDVALETLVGLLDDNPDMDGICLDFEGVLSTDRDALTAFVADLREAMDQSRPGSHLSICTPAVDWAGAFDYDLLASNCDALFMMCYPFHGSWSDEAGPCCPLTGWGAGPESPANMAWSLGDYVIHAPSVHDKLVVGLPYYGFEWETEDGNPHSVVDGSCSTLSYSSLASRAETHGRLWDPESLTPWYRYRDPGWRQGWFDDPGSLSLKYSLILGSGFQGAGIWALGYDGSRPELWNCIEQWFTEPPQRDRMTDNLEATFTLHGPSNYWHYSGTGMLYSHFYTFTVGSGPDVNWAEWRFDLPDSSAYGMLEAWVPEGSQASAVYRIHHGGGIDTVLVDQAGLQGCWAMLGGPYRAMDGLSVLLGDRAGTAGRRLGFDAIRFQECIGIAPGDDPPTGLTLMPAGSNPAREFTISCPPAGGESELLILDCSGRIVFRAPVAAGENRTVSWPASPMPQGVYLAILAGPRSLLTAPLRLVLLR